MLTNAYLDEKSVMIQPRTRLGKTDVSYVLTKFEMLCLSRSDVDVGGAYFEEW